MSACTFWICHQQPWAEDSRYLFLRVNMTDVTPILNAIEQGDERTTDELLPLIYDELRILAAQKMSQLKESIQKRLKV